MSPRIRTYIAAGLFALLPLTAGAATITFPGPIGTPVTPTVEGNYTYSTFSGGLYRDTQGNGDAFNMEGLSNVGGVLRLARNDIAGGLFFFDQADVAWQFNISAGIRFEGFLLGASVGFDTFVTTANSAYSTHPSSFLAGVAIDELRVTLGGAGNSAAVVDNIVLRENARSVPDAASAITLLGLTLLGIAGVRRKMSA
jgi:hypothetical protein